MFLLTSTCGSLAAFLELRRQEFEHTRALAAGEDQHQRKKPVRRKPKKKDSLEGKEQPPKKRPRKPSVSNVGGVPGLASPSKVGEEPAEVFSIDAIMAQLRQLPTLTLQEPEVVTCQLAYQLGETPPSNTSKSNIETSFLQRVTVVLIKTPFETNLKLSINFV